MALPHASSDAWGDALPSPAHRSGVADRDVRAYSRLDDLPIGAKAYVPLHAVCQDVDDGDRHLYVGAMLVTQSERAMRIKRVGEREFHVLVPDGFRPYVEEVPFRRARAEDVLRLTRLWGRLWSTHVV